MEGLIGSSLCRGVRSCLARRRVCSNSYQRLRAPPPPGRGVRLSRRTVLSPAAWSCRFAGLRRRACARWSPLQLLNRVLDTYIGSMLSAPAARPPSPPRLQRRDASPGSRSRRRDAAGGRGVMLNFCVAEVLLRRTTSEVRRSPLQQQLTRNAARCSSVRS